MCKVTKYLIIYCKYNFEAISTSFDSEKLYFKLVFY